MRCVFLLFLFINSLIFSKESKKKENALDGIQSFTVFTQVSPYGLNLNIEEAMKASLKKIGKIIQINSNESLDANFLAAISNTAFLRISLENWITELVDKDKKTYKVDVHLVLECFKRTNATNLQQDKEVPLWIAEEVFDFSSDPQVLIAKAKKAEQRLIDQFKEAIHSSDRKSENQIQFYFL